MEALTFVVVRRKEDHGERFINLNQIAKADAFPNGDLQLFMTSREEITIEDKETADHVLGLIRQYSVSPSGSFNPS